MLFQAFKVGDDDEPTRMDYVMHLVSDSFLMS